MEELPVLEFSDIKKFHNWLDMHCQISKGVWLKISKKSSGIQSISYEEALDESLCYGWVDSQKKPLDDNFWLQRFTPRKKSGIWSARNRERVLKLLKEGRMQPPGLSAMEDAKKSGSWDRAYQSQSKIQVPAEFQQMLDKNPEAAKFFESLDSVNRYSVLFRIQKQKTQTNRLRKMEEFLQMLLEKRTIHPKR